MMNRSLLLLCLGLCLGATPCWAVTPADTAAIDLHEAEDIALRQNRSVSLAQTAVDAAQSGIEQASARPNPLVSLTTQHYRMRPNGMPQQPDQQVAFSDTWERGGKRDLRIQVAHAMSQMAAADAADTRRQVLHDVRWAWFDLWQAEGLVALARRTADASERSLEAAIRRRDAGDLPGADVERLRVESDRAVNDWHNAETTRRHAQAALATLLACETQASQLATRGTAPPPVPRDSDERERLIDLRPDVQSAQHALEAARQAVALAGAQRSRDLGWTVSAERDRASGLGNTVGIGVTVPLLWGNDYHGDIGHALADQHAAQQRLELIQAQARAEAAQGEADVRDAIDQMHRFDAGVLVSAQRAADAAEFAYTHGAAGLMDLLDARRTLQGVQAQALQARVALWKAGADRDAAVPTEQDTPR